MAITEPPKVRLELQAGGRGKAFINGFELPWLTRVRVELDGGDLTRVYLEMRGDVEATLDGASIELSALPLNGGARRNDVSAYYNQPEGQD